MPTFMREIRQAAGLSLTEISDATGLTRGDLSRIETGHGLPLDKHVPALESVYGSASTWYPPAVLLSIQADRAEVAE